MTERQRLIKKLDDRIRDIVRERDQECITCGIRLTPANRTAGHFIHRRHLGTRWDVSNVWGQCSDCNIQDNDERFTLALRNKCNEKFVSDLITAGHRNNHFSTSDLKRIYEELKKT
jgi:5-methylcytosine-specific restriction endonuclease McrA